MLSLTPPRHTSTLRIPAGCDVNLLLEIATLDALSWAQAV